MADNLTIKDASSTDRQVATDDVAGVHYERNKLSIGDDGAAVDASLKAPVPVAFGAQPISDFLEAKIDCSTLGDNTLVAGVAGQTIRVYAFFLMVGGPVDLKFKDGPTSPAGDYFPPWYFLAKGNAWEMIPMGRPWFTTTTGNALILNLSTATQVSGRLYYTKS